MKFIKKGRYFVRSECGRFQISVANIGDKKVYSAWDLKSTKSEKTALVAGVSLVAAKKVCRELADDSV